jgi:hypothetical protein
MLLWSKARPVCKAGNLNILNLGVCILLRVLDQVQGFPSNATLIQYLNRVALDGNP